MWIVVHHSHCTCVTAMESVVFRSACHQPPGTNTVSPNAQMIWLVSIRANLELPKYCHYHHYYSVWWRAAYPRNSWSLPSPRVHWAWCSCPWPRGEACLWVHIIHQHYRISIHHWRLPGGKSTHRLVPFRHVFQAEVPRGSTCTPVPDRSGPVHNSVRLECLMDLDTATSGTALRCIANKRVK